MVSFYAFQEIFIDTVTALLMGVTQPSGASRHFLRSGPLWFKLTFFASGLLLDILRTWLCCLKLKSLVWSITYWTRNTFYGTRYLPIALLALRLTLYSLTGSRVWLLGSRDVIGHVTIWTAVGRFLLVIHWHHVPIFHRCRDIKRHNLDNHIPIVNTLENNFGDFRGQNRGLCHFQ